jgi:hypothetical protein
MKTEYDKLKEENAALRNALKNLVSVMPDNGDIYEDAAQYRQITEAIEGAELLLTF